MLAFSCSPLLAQEQDEWIEMFNGKDLSGWQVNENPESVYVEDGCLVTNGKRAHVFYVGANQYFHLYLVNIILNKILLFYDSYVYITLYIKAEA